MLLRWEQTKQEYFSGGSSYQQYRIITAKEAKIHTLSKLQMNTLEMREDICHLKQSTEITE